MTKACLLSAGGDVIINSFFWKIFKERWYNEVDRIWIHLNNHAETPYEAINDYFSMVSADPKVRIIYHPLGCGNGRPITEMALISQEDLVVLMEDDCYPFTPGVVERNFKMIESGEYDAVGSPRFSCGQEIADAAKTKYNLDYSGYGDKGPTFWPAFFFCKRADLLRTDQNFASYEYTKGVHYPEIDHTMSETQYGDTFVHASLQLHALGLRFKEIPAHKADPYELQSKDVNMMNYHPSQQPFDYIHAGSLSSGWAGFLNKTIPDVSTDIAKQEMESRAAFWSIAANMAPSDFHGLTRQYLDGIRNLIEKAPLDQNRIDQKIGLYRELMKI